jgi:hypothetical protein
LTTFSAPIAARFDGRTIMRTFVGIGIVLLMAASAAFPQPASKEYEVGKAGLTLEGKITADDAMVKVTTLINEKTFELPAKSYSVKLTGGKSFVVTMRSEAIDSFLVVHDASGKQLEYDDDSGGDSDAQLTIDVKETATFRVFAGSLKGVGPFTLTIRTR